MCFWAAGMSWSMAFHKPCRDPAHSSQRMDTELLCSPKNPSEASAKADYGVAIFSIHAVMQRTPDNLPCNPMQIHLIARLSGLGILGIRLAVIKQYGPWSLFLKTLDINTLEGPPRSPSNLDISISPVSEALLTPSREP